MTASFHIRPAETGDLPSLGHLGAQLVRYHRELDARRFMDIPGVEDGYARFLGAQLANPHSVVISAVQAGAGATASQVVGYAFGTIEPRDWNALLGPHGALHDVIVDASARRARLGEALVVDICKRLEALGAPRVVLHTAVQNVAAQALFAKLGFRTTMLEMTREAGPA